MNIKGLTKALTLSVLATGAAATSQAATTSYVYARVVDVEPIVRHVTVQRPRRECWEEIVYQREPAGRPFGAAGQTLAGGIIGAAIGRQFGGGSGRDAATVAGAIAGSAVANERAHRVVAARGPGAVHAVPVERCEVVNERFTEERIDGYWVTYAYQGQRYRMRTSQPPGDRVQLRVSVQPVGF
jgi:uncharacterized protein YcfJ